MSLPPQLWPSAYVRRAPLFVAGTIAAVALLLTNLNAGIGWRFSLMLFGTATTTNPLALLVNICLPTSAILGGVFGLIACTRRADTTIVARAWSAVLVASGLLGLVVLYGFTPIMEIHGATISGAPVNQFAVRGPRVTSYVMDGGILDYYVTPAELHVLGARIWSPPFPAGTFVIVILLGLATVVDPAPPRDNEPGTKPTRAL